VPTDRKWHSPAFMALHAWAVAANILMNERVTTTAAVDEYFSRDLFCLSGSSDSSRACNVRRKHTVYLSIKVTLKQPVFYLPARSIKTIFFIYLFYMPPIRVHL
jgi:hypothetical protein